MHTATQAAPATTGAVATTTEPLDVVVYDIEIARCIPDRNAPRDTELLYCAGWEDYANMGIAVLCAFDTRTRDPRVFLADNLGEFATLIEGRTVAGFNNRSFDDRLLAANGVQVGRSWDLLCEVRKAVGEPEAFTRGRTAPGRTLDALCGANLTGSKSMKGAMAPVEWQRGNWGSVIDYCMRDVMLTARLIQKLPAIVDPVTRRTLTVPRPAAEAC
jgi:hypothetical protein